MKLHPKEAGRRSWTICAARRKATANRVLWRSAHEAQMAIVDMLVDRKVHLALLPRKWVQEWQRRLRST
jgi:hypothetical protein